MLDLSKADGSIDSIVVGGSFSYARSLVEAMDKKAEDNKAAPAVAVVPDVVVA